MYGENVVKNWKTIYKIFEWICSGFFLLLALGSISQIVPLIFCLIAGVLCNPLTQKWFKTKKWIVIPGTIIAFIIAVVAYKTPEVEPTDESLETKVYSQNSLVSNIQTDEEIVAPTSTPSIQMVAEEEKSPSPSLNASIQAPSPTPSKEPTPNTEPSVLEVHFIDVGQGDSILLMCDGESMLIDAGDNDKGTTVQLYLKKRGIEKLKYVIGTHPDSDHIGGLDVILYKFDCETVILPNKTNDTNTYRDVIDTINTKGYKITPPSPGDTCTLGGATFTILGPRRSYDDNNNNSVVIRLTHGNNTFLFEGDAEESAESDIVNSGAELQSTVLKLGHHGSHSSTSSSFLKKVSPTFAVICCGQGNSYGHPHSETLNKLRESGVQVFRTDEQGSIVATSDGINLTWNVSPSQTWQAGEQSAVTSSEVVAPPTNVEAPSAVVDQPSCSYVKNKNTKKFHRPECGSVSEMKEKNKEYSNQTREEIIAEGYSPCKRCNP